MLGHESVRVFVITRQRTTGSNKYEPIREKLKKKTKISQLEHVLHRLPMYKEK